MYTLIGTYMHFWSFLKVPDSETPIPFRYWWTTQDTNTPGETHPKWTPASNELLSNSSEDGGFEDNWRILKRNIMSHYYDMIWWLTCKSWRCLIANFFIAQRWGRNGSPPASTKRRLVSLWDRLSRLDNKLWTWRGPSCRSLSECSCKPWCWCILTRKNDPDPGFLPIQISNQSYSTLP